jgi:pyrroline-5-carboxylate reductase
MGSAMLSGWRERGLSASVAVDPAPDAARNAGPDLTVVGDPASVPAGFAPAAVVLAVKPQSAAEALPAYARFAGSAVFLSIMAGRTIGGLQALLGGSAAIVRAMPNTPAAVRQGITVATPSASVTSGQRALCGDLLRAIGLVEWVEQESLLDPVTAVSGSGPAYVFLLAELMEQAAIEQGIAPELARVLARQTVAGSGALLAASPESAADLRKAVTSPAGTTEAALKVLMAPDALPHAFSEAIAAATRRSRELAG